MYCHLSSMHWLRVKYRRSSTSRSGILLVLRQRGRIAPSSALQIACASSFRVKLMWVEWNIQLELKKVKWANNKNAEEKAYLSPIHERVLLFVAPDGTSNPNLEHARRCDKQLSYQLPVRMIMHYYHISHKVDKFNNVNYHGAESDCQDYKDPWHP